MSLPCVNVFGFMILSWSSTNCYESMV